MLQTNEKRASGRGFFSLVAITLLCCCVNAPVSAQDATGTEGVQPLFRFGAGARAIGVGNAMAAMPVDATAIVWNPGGLDNLERKNAVMFYANLFGGTKYHFVGYAHPAMDLGTFGVAWLHLDVGDIRYTDTAGADDGIGVHAQDQFLVSYSKKLPFSLSLGGALKLDRISFTDVDPASAVSLDFGLFYKPELTGFGEDLAIGFAIQNLIEPRLKLKTASDSLPRAFRAGAVKPLRVGGEGNLVNLFLGYQSGARGSKSLMQFGGEYIYQNRAMLRLGMNGGSPAYGGGVVYQNFQIDYALGKFSSDAEGEVFGAQHRVSMTMQLGKSKQELLDARRRKEEARIAESIAREQRLKDQAAFAKAMEDGRIYFDKGDFFQAQIAFNDATRTFPGDEDGQIWAKKAQEKFNEQQRVAAEERERLAATRAKRESDSLFVESQIELGMKYFNAGDFGEAVRQWEVGLNRAPKNTRLQELITKTKGELDNRATDVLKKARSAELAGRFSEAIQIYNKALSEGSLTASQRAEITNQITKLQNQLNGQEQYKQGVAAYLARDYRTALSYFDEVIKVEPRNNLAQKYRYDAESRLNAQAKDFATDQVRARFAEAAKLSQRGNFTEAVKILEEIQRQDRYNKRILDAIDQARDKINRK